MLIVYHWELSLKRNWFRSQSEGAGRGARERLPDEPQLSALLAVQAMHAFAFVACYTGFICSLAPMLTPLACSTGAAVRDAGSAWLVAA